MSDTQNGSAGQTLPAPACSAWVPLQTKSPEKDGHYLIWVRDEWDTGWKDQAVIGYYIKRTDDWDTDGGIVEDGGTITHWAEIYSPNARDQAPAPGQAHNEERKP